MYRLKEFLAEVKKPQYVALRLMFVMLLLATGAFASIESIWWLWRSLLITLFVACTVSAYAFECVRIILNSKRSKKNSVIRNIKYDR